MRAAAAETKASAELGELAELGGGAGTFRETEPVKGPGPEAFVLLPEGPRAEAGPTDHRHSADAHPDPVLVDPVPPSPPPPPRQTTADEVSSVAYGLSLFFASGVVSLFAKHPELRSMLGALSGPAPDGASADPLAYLPQVTQWVQAAATRACMKHSLVIPYQDEAVCVLAIGVGALGHFGKSPSNDPVEEKPAALRSVPQ